MPEQPPPDLKDPGPDRRFSIEIVPYDPAWPDLFRQERHLIAKALGTAALAIDHVGSTAVDGMAAKPVIDIHLTVLDSSDEAVYATPLCSLGYRLSHREPDWFEHRLFKRSGPEVNLHVFSQGCPELRRCLLFRDWLRISARDRKRYLTMKTRLADRRWLHVQDYADAKSEVIAEIMATAESWAATRDRS